MNILLFDYDGTILDVLDVAWKAFNEAASKFHVPLLSSSKEFTGLYYNNFYDSLKNYGVPADKRIEFTNYMRQVFERSDSKFNVFPGLFDVLNKLSEESELYIISSNFTDIIKNSLKRRNVNCFKQIIGGDKETSKVIKIMTLKEQYPNAKFFYIGDTVADINEAKKAEVKTVAVTWGYHSREQLEQAKPDMIIESPEELLKII